MNPRHSAPGPEDFDALYGRQADPWRLEGSWYEERKRALLLASLPERRYATAYEPGCAQGTLTRELAARCDRLLATDGSARAAQAARERLASCPNVEVAQAWVPAQWPAQRFALIVLSEFLYYLDAASLDGLAAAVAASLEPGGTVVACHWRPPIDGCALAGEEVHLRLHGRLCLPRLAQVADADFCLDVWSGAGASPARREGKV